MNKSLAVALLMVPMSCKDPLPLPPPPTHAELLQQARESAELIQATPCVDVAYDMARYGVMLTCSRPNQTLSW